MIKGFELIGAALADALKKEIREQGHVASGRLINSIKSSVVLNGSEAIISVSYDDYGIYVNKGRKAGVLKVPIDALMRWLNIKGIGQTNKRRGIAFAIQRKIYNEGSPTRNSYRFSNNGRRKLFNEETLAQEMNNIVKILEQLLTNEFQAQLSTI